MFVVQNKVDGELRIVYSVKAKFPHHAIINLTAPEGGYFLFYDECKGFHWSNMVEWIPASNTEKTFMFKKANGIPI